MTAGSFGTVYNAGLYGRLSVLDNGKTDGDSIESQIDLMERYVAERPYLHRAGLFVDNGYSGTDFARPDWDRLMEAVRAGEINCIVVKDLSRFGRNYIETGQLLEKVFPRLGIRFISINDGYDSALLNSTDELAASLKNIVNDYYAKDISLKSHSALDGKRRRGEFVGGYAPHGYQKDPQNKTSFTTSFISDIWLRARANPGYMKDRPSSAPMKASGSLSATPMRQSSTKICLPGYRK